MIEDVEAPERLKKAVLMWDDEFEAGEEFDYCGITMVRADTDKPMYYPKQVGRRGLVNVGAIAHASEVEKAIHESIEYWQ